MAYESSLRENGQPFHRERLSTAWSARTAGPGCAAQDAGAIGLFLLAAGATLTISASGPGFRWGYAAGVIVLASLVAIGRLANGRVAIRRVAIRRVAVGRSVSQPADDALSALNFRRCLSIRVPIASLLLVAIAAWGLAQWLAGATVYRYATLDAAVRWTALAATASAARALLCAPRIRGAALRWFAIFGFAVSVVALLAYFTSPGRVLWLFPSRYPDVWGPFLSRNDFAGFLELSFPVAWWLGLGGPVTRRPGEGFQRRSGPLSPAAFVWMAAWMLAAGLASASRAGGVLLLAEALAVAGLVACRPPRRSAMASPVKRAAGRLVVLACLFGVAAGAGTLVGRFEEHNPFEGRREIAASTLAMIRERPWLGFGLGTFRYVYPGYASFDPGAVVEHAHNDWLEWAAEGGLPFAGACLALACTLIPKAMRSIWGIGIIAAFVHALVDYPFARFGLAAWTFVLIGAVEAHALGMREVRDSPH